MKNQEIREAIKRARVKHWQIAAELGIGESTLVRWLRFDLTEERKNLILSAVEKVSAENG